jgi:hypothetical protein
MPISASPRPRCSSTHCLCQYHGMAASAINAQTRCSSVTGPSRAASAAFPLGQPSINHSENRVVHLPSVFPNQDMAITSVTFVGISAVKPSDLRCRLDHRRNERRWDISRPERTQLVVAHLVEALCSLELKVAACGALPRRRSRTRVSLVLPGLGQDAPASGQNAVLGT